LRWQNAINTLKQNGLAFGKKDGTDSTFCAFMGVEKAK
jgi:hypothetical protein